MTSELLFRLVNLAALPPWLLMIFAPHWWLTRRLMTSLIGPVFFAVLYLILSVPHLGEVLAAFSRGPELDSIAELLGRRDITVVAWIHYLAFDLFVGRWEYLDSQEKGISAWLVGPALALTLMLGPIGLLTYLGVRWATVRA